MNKGLKRFIALIMVVLMMAMYVPTASAITKTGSLGNNVSWSYDSTTRVLTVTGSGDMKNFTSNNNGQGLRSMVVGTAAPVQYPHTHATRIVINEGVTNIGNYALAGLTAVTSVQLPSTVKSIGNNAFDGCSALTTINITNNITSIGSNAFKNTKFANVSLPYSVKTIGDNAFSGISGLKITCNYGDAAYNYAVKHSSSYAFRQPSVVLNTALDPAAKQVKLTFKIKDASGFNAGNFTLNYNDAVTPVSDSLQADDVNNNTELASAIVYNEKGKISIAMMATDRISYSKCADECSYTVAEFVFNINGQADNAEFTVTPDAVLANDLRVTAKSATATASLHKYVDTVTKAATCKETGIKNSTCSICGKATESTIAKDPANHSAYGTEVKNKVASTCTKEGYTGDTVCLGCGITLSKGSAIPVADHEYEGTTTSATCAKEGFVTYKCKNCGESYIGDKIPALGHDYEAVSTVPATCTKKGSVTYKCKVCGESYSEESIPALGHDYKAVSTVDATCTEGGYTTYACTRCDDSYVGDKTAALGHKYDENGKCIRCDDEIVVAISFKAGSKLEADEKSAMVISKVTATASEITAQVAAGNWTITDAKGSAVSGDSAVKTGYIIKNTTAGKAYTIIILGDVNLDGKVNASDARLALRISAKLDTPTAIQSTASDVNKDGKTNASDARNILRVSAKLDPSF